MKVELTLIPHGWQCDIKDCKTSIFFSTFFSASSALYFISGNEHKHDNGDVRTKVFNDVGKAFRLSLPNGQPVISRWIEEGGSKDMGNKRLVIVPNGWPCTLEECEPGFFVVDERNLCFKTEYFKEDGSPEAYNEAGEAYYGTKENVQPVMAIWEYEE